MHALIPPRVDLDSGRGSESSLSTSPERSYAPPLAQPGQPVTRLLSTDARRPSLQFAAGWWMFLDATMLSKHAIPITDPNSPYDPVPVHVTFADWTPGICSTIGMIIVNLIDKQRLMNDDNDGGWSDGFAGGAAWRARLFLFMGFALMAGGLAGSVVSEPFCALLGLGTPAGWKTGKADASVLPHLRRSS